MAQILITGFTGGIGRATAKELTESGHIVKALVRSVEKGKKYAAGLKNIELIQGDAANANDLLKAAEGCTHFVYGINIPYNNWEEKAISMLETSLKVAAEKKLRFVFPGNVYVYGRASSNPVAETHPFSPHTKKGKIRVQMENLIKKYAQEKGFDYTIVRMPDFYGPFVVNGFSEQMFINALKGKTLTWIGDPSVKTEYIFIEDGGIAMAEAGLSDNGKNAEFNIPAYEPVKTGDFVQKIADMGGKNSKKQIMNSDLIFGIMGLFNPLVKEVKEMLYLKREELLLDGSLYKSTFGNIPRTPYEDGMKRTFEWVNTFYK